MFRANRNHLQPLLISNINDLPDAKRKRLEKSWAQTFYQEFFCRIDEEAFSVLYVDYPSRPNVPINWLVGLSVLKAGYGWSDEELYDHFCFDLQVRYALGLHDLHEGDFDLRSLYYFRERLSCYNLEHGINLLNQAFEKITDKQITDLKVKTGRQRMDSTMVSSNILDMSRLQLLVTALQRIYRALSESDQQRYAETFAPYLRGHAGQYVYRIKGKKAVEKQLNKIGKLMQRLLAKLREAYGEEPAYQVLLRLFNDNYRIEETEVYAKANEELEAGCLQSVDDLEATYRKKGQRKYKGYGVNLSETCDPENELQLITQVQVAPNNVDDTQLLSEGLPNLKERTGVEVLYTDGGYAGPTVDPVLEQCQVEQIPTGIRGREPNPDSFNLADFKLESSEDGHPEKITCPQGQTVAVLASKRQKSFQADFDPQICQTCPFQHEGRCPAHPGKKRAAFRLTFRPSQIPVAQRRQKMRYREGGGKNPRAAIEGTIREVKHPFHGSKLPVRGLFGVTTLMVSSAAMTNVRRIHHYLERKRRTVEQMERQNQKENAESVQSSSSFWLFVNWLQEWFSSLVMFRKLCFDC